MLWSVYIVEAGKEGLPRQKLVQMFIKISRKVLDLEISDHMGWKALCFLFLVICVLAPKDLLRPPCASLFIKKNVFLVQKSINMRFPSASITIFMGQMSHGQKSRPFIRLILRENLFC